MTKPYYQRISYRLLRNLRSWVAVKIGARQLVVATAPTACLAFLFWHPSWKTELIGTLLAGRTGTFVDIGANVGTTLLDYLAAGESEILYLGFEPNPECVSFLSGFIQRNGLRDCTLAPVALSDSTTMLKLHLLPGRRTDSAATLIRSLRPTATFETILVPCFRFDDLRQTLGVEEIALVKIDVEGAELEVLRGMTATIGESRPFILCEVLHADAQIQEEPYRARIDALRELLGKLDYTIWHILKSPGGELIELERIEAFPFRIWAHETAEECDYLFVPKAAEMDLERFGLKVSR